jgi:pyruvate ferredoxin oxidoreductase beta subunit
VVLYEIEDGVRRVTKRVARRKPVSEYLALQRRFRHVLDDADALAVVQAGVDAHHDALLATM